MTEPLRLATPHLVGLVTVIRVEAARGLGTNDDPVRVVTQYWSTEGALLAERDPNSPYTEEPTR